MSRKSRRTKSPKFLMVLDYLYRSAAFQSLDGNARSVYLELLALYNGRNNGMIGLSSRDAGAVVNKKNDTGARALEMLLDRGFIAIASNSTFDQKKLAREWRLTHLPDDRTGHAASKEFMRWGLENQKPVAQVRSIVAQVRKETPKSGESAPHSRTHATVLPNSHVSQSHLCDTYRSTIPPVRQTEAVRLAEEAPGHTGGAPRSEQTVEPIEDIPARSNKPVHVSDALRGILGLGRAPQPSVRNFAEPPCSNLSEGERSLLRWLQSYGENATHRKTQQNLSGQLKGDAIAEAALALVERGLIRIGEKGRSSVYIVLDAGRDPALLNDSDQMDLEHWLAQAAQ